MALYIHEALNNRLFLHFPRPSNSVTEDQENNKQEVLRLTTLKIGSIHLHYEVLGSGEPLFLNNGASHTCHYWDRYLNWLVDKYTVVIHDSRGQGLTSAPRGEDQNSYEVLAEDLNRLMEHLRIESAIVGGSSMGGAVSHAFALKYPQKVKALILSDNVGHGIPEPGTKVSKEEMERLNKKREYIIHKYGVMEWAYRELEAAQIDVTEPTEEQMVRLRRMAKLSVNGAIYSYRFITRSKVPGIERTKELTMPTLIIIGDQDVNLAGAEWLRDTIPNRRYALLTNAGHATVQTKPAAWRKATQEFLDDVKAGVNIRKECIY
jgi:pimeloyl-ACP methyl ester carboxylesterase